MLDIPLPKWPRNLKAVLELPHVRYEDRSRLPQVTAVYFAVVDRSTVAYVGCTGNLRQRWYAHHHRDRLMTMGSLTIAYVTCEYGPVLWRAEVAGILQFWPPLNMETQQKIKHGYAGLKPQWPTDRWLTAAKRDRPEDFTKWDWVNEGLLDPPLEWQMKHYPEAFVSRPSDPPA